ncbi:Transcription elongation factor [Candidatus Phytoplasma mali]|uniref:Transcription elongation factor GreA n=1 Tax=Phytoplasma mali (strain AT) TaxID=482235 RepID=B3QZP6_PHYMT|nr:transcription elongation factor GreA [Candidatus Phytoplasma mali]CAP18433.1 Transcription elongation factor [Candidatus Phytoplasma mali]
MEDKKNIYELTKSGVLELKEQLHHLTEIRRIENLKILKEAREQGDLSENADYDAARNEQALIENEILKIKNILKKIKIIKSLKNKEVNIGKLVELNFLEKNIKKSFYLVGILETDPSLNKISIDCPLGKGIRGHQVGDKITIQSETGKNFQVEILKVEQHEL